MKTRGFLSSMSERMEAQLIDDLELWAELRYAHDKAMCAYQARILGAGETARLGVPVTNGACNVMRDLESYWVQRRDMVQMMIDFNTVAAKVGIDVGMVLYDIGHPPIGMTMGRISHEEYNRWVKHNDRLAQS